MNVFQGNNCLLEAHHSDSFANASMTETLLIVINAISLSNAAKSSWTHNLYVYSQDDDLCSSKGFCLCFSKEKHGTGYIPVNCYLSPVAVLAQPTLFFHQMSESEWHITHLWKIQPASRAILTTDSRLVWNQLWLSFILVISDTFSVPLLCLI